MQISRLMLLMWSTFLIFPSDGVDVPTLSFSTPSAVGKYLLDRFAVDELIRSRFVQAKYNITLDKLHMSFTQTGKRFNSMQKMSFRLSTTPFVTTAGFRDLCYPNVLDNNGGKDSEGCTLPLNVVHFFQNIKDGACLFMTSKCYYTVMDLNLLRHIPHRFTIVSHFSDRAVPDMDKAKKLYGVKETSSQLEKLHDSGKLLAFHAMNLYYKDWIKRPKPTWLHCLPLGMRLRYWQPREELLGFLVAIKRNVVERPQSFWADTKRPLLLVPIVPKKYAPDRHKALLQLTTNVKKNILNMTRKTYEKQTDFLDAVSNHRFTLCPWGNGLDTHRLYEVLAMGSIPVVRASSINSCVDSTDNNITVKVVDPHTGLDRTDVISRGDIPVVVVRRWSDVTSDLLEAHWTAFTTGTIMILHQKTPGAAANVSSEYMRRLAHWDYSRLTMEHWQQRILGLLHNNGARSPDFSIRA